MTSSRFVRYCSTNVEAGACAVNDHRLACVRGVDGPVSQREQVQRTKKNHGSDPTRWITRGQSTHGPSCYLPKPLRPRLSKRLFTTLLKIDPNSKLRPTEIP